MDPDVIALQEASTGPRRGNVAGRLAGPRPEPRVRRPRSSGAGSPDPPLQRGTGDPEPVPHRRARRPTSSRAAGPAGPAGAALREIVAPGGLVPVFSTHTSGELCHAESRRAGPGAAAATCRDAHGGLQRGGVSGSIQALTARPASWTRSAAKPGPPGSTVWQHVRAPDPAVRRRVDYVSWPPGARSPGAVVGSRVVVEHAPGRLSDGSVLWPSDHYGVLADLALGPARARAD